MHNPTGADQDISPQEEEFDEIVLCVLADTAKRILGKEARSSEKFVLGRTTWSDDITVTHSVRNCGSLMRTVLMSRTRTTSKSGTLSNSTRNKLYRS